MQLVNGTFSDLVYTDPINIFVPRMINNKIWIDPDIEYKAHKRADQLLKNRTQAFGSHTVTGSTNTNEVHFIAESPEQLEILKSHVVFKNPYTLPVITTGAKFIPCPGPNKWESHLGLKQQICTLFNRMIWGYWRHTTQAEKQEKLNRLTELGLKPCFPRFRPIKNLDQVRETAHLIGRIGGFPVNAFMPWAEDIYTTAKNICINNLKRNSKAQTVARRERNLNSGMFEALQTLRSYRHEIGIGIADKNLGPTVYSLELYNKLQHKYLGESGVYIRLGDCNKSLRFELMNKQREQIKKAFDLIDCTLRLTNEIKWLLWQIETGAKEATKLAGFYLIIKVHKMSVDIPTRPIQPAIGTVTEHISRWLHSITEKTVFEHKNVIRNTEAWIKATKDLKIYGSKPALVTMDVEALYPSIGIKEGSTAFEWFLRTYCHHINEGLISFCVELARIVLIENYIEAWPCGIYQQISGTAMGTSFAVVYAVIFMIWYETPIIEEFKEHISLYGRYIDDGQTIWTGPDNELDRFVQVLQTKNKNIKWVVKISKEASEFLDVQTNICDFVDDNGHTAWGFTHKIYRKPLNTYAYLPQQSYHGRHIPIAWIKAELFRFETLCTFKEDFDEAKNFFLAKLADRGYTLKFLKKAAGTYTWESIKQEKHLRVTQNTNNNNKALEAQKANGCIFTITRCPYTQGLLNELNIQPHEIDSDVLREIYPYKPMVVYKNAQNMRTLLPKCKKPPKDLL